MDAIVGIGPGEADRTHPSLMDKFGITRFSVIQTSAYVAIGANCLESGFRQRFFLSSPFHRLNDPRKRLLNTLLKGLTNAPLRKGNTLGDERSNAQLLTWTQTQRCTDSYLVRHDRSNRKSFWDTIGFGIHFVIP